MERYIQYLSILLNNTFVDEIFAIVYGFYIFFKTLYKINRNMSSNQD